MYNIGLLKMPIFDKPVPKIKPDTKILENHDLNHTKTPNSIDYTRPPTGIAFQNTIKFCQY